MLQFFERHVFLWILLALFGCMGALVNLLHPFSFPARMLLSGVLFFSGDAILLAVFASKVRK